MTETSSYRNQSIDLIGKSMDWFIYDNGLRHERGKKVVSAFILPDLKNTDTTLTFKSLYPFYLRYQKFLRDFFKTT